MATSLIDLNRISYLKTTGTGKNKVLSYLSARYLNLKYVLPARDSYMVTEADACNLPGLAKRFYGDQGYWWVIAFYNGIIFPEVDLQPGRVLQLPSLTDINALLSSDVDNTLTNVTI